LAAHYDLQDAVIAGNSFGGWIAAEVLVRDTSRFGAAVLVDPLGCKFGPRTEREIADMHALDQATYRAQAWADPANAAEDLTAKPESELAQIAQGKEAFALFGWKPYMHNPRLKNWLHRIVLPTLVVRGEQDRITSRAYTENWVQALPHASLATIADAGHYPQWEQPDVFTSLVTEFAKS
jgi:pimeloyl-ACP methyl ester carboxylesterase